MHDTPPHITQKVIDIIQTKTPEQRIKMGCSMNETSRHLMIRSILEKNPHISNVGLRQELFLLYYGDDFDLETKQKILKHLEQCR